MGKTELIIFTFLATLGLREFHLKVNVPAIERARQRYEDICKVPYTNLFEKLTQDYSAETKYDLENEIDEFAKDVFSKGMDYAYQFRYLIPEENEELFLSLFAEEGFGKQDAVSPKGNVGLGQLSEKVARAQGLRIIKKGNKIIYDERCIPDLNVRASLAYYNALCSEFGRHDLALLAYNHGPAKVKKALKSAGTAVTAADLLEKFNHKKFNYLVKILGYAQHISSERYSSPQFNQLFERKQIEDEKNLEEVARKNGLSLKAFLACNPQFKDPNYCKPGLFYIISKNKTQNLKPRQKRLK